MLRTKKPKQFQYIQELNTLGDHVRTRRLNLGLFQRHVAEQIGVDEDTICRWENNETCPSVQHIPAIIGFLGYNPLPAP